jgi:hypothetical protein
MGLKSYRLWAMCQLDSTCRSPPRRGGAPSAQAPRQPFTAAASVSVVNPLDASSSTAVTASQNSTL